MTVTWDELRRYPIARQLLQCQWGHTIGLPDDPDPCTGQATRIIILHDNTQQITVRLCPGHTDRVLNETTPHQDNPA